MGTKNEGLFQKVYSSVSEIIRKNNLEQECSNEFAKPYDIDHVKYLVDIAWKNKCLAISPLRTCKSETTALSFKDQGNTHFKRRAYLLALRQYNKAILSASLNENTFALCLANRSAALFELQKYNETLSDIQLAIKHNYPQDMLYKLLVRKAKCYQFVDASKLSASVEEAIKALEMARIDEAVKSLCRNSLSKLEAKVQDTDNQKPITPQATSTKRVEGCSPLSNSADVVDNNEFGRYIRATKDILPGEIVLVEKPFCSVTLPDSYLTHCSYCQKRIEFDPYPCRSCADIIYCNPQCERAGHSEFHQYECEHILNIKAVNINMGHLALRSAVKAGYSKLRETLDENVASTVEYGNIFYLVGHEEERTMKDKFWRATAAVVLSKMCDVEKWAGAAEDAVEVLTTCVYRHMQTFPCNAHEISEVIYDEKLPYQSELVEVGAGIYGMLSMFNHSCDPSVVRVFQEGNTCVMRAISPIGISDQVYDNYGILSATHSSNARQSKLQSQYYFQCVCTPCMQDWPLYDSLSYTSTPLYKCADCETMIIPPFGGECDNCHQTFNKAAVDEKLEKAKVSFDTCLSKLFTTSYRQHNIMDSAKQLEGYSQLVNSLIIRPYKTLNDCQEALKHVYGLLGNVVIKESD